MDLREPLDWAALLFIGYAGLSLVGQLVPAVGALFVVATVLAFVAFLLLVIGHRRVDEAYRPMLLGASILTLVWAFVVVVLFVLANPITIKGEPGRGINTSPSDAIATAYHWASILWVGVVAVAAGLAWPLDWEATAKRLVGGGGILVGLIVLLGQTIGLPAAPALSWLGSGLLSLGFLGLLIGFTMIVRRGEDPA